MRELLSAMQFRLRRSGIFWACCAAALAVGVWLGVAGGMQNVRELESFDMPMHPLNSILFEVTPFFGFFAAVAVPVFLGAEYGDGAIRNKLIAGHRRESVYLADLLTATGASLLLLACLLLGGLVAAPNAAPWSLSASETLRTLLGLALSAAVYASVFTLVSMLLTRRAAAPVVSLLLVLGLLLLASFLFNVLQEPEMLQQGFVLEAVRDPAAGEAGTVPFNVTLPDPEPNPNYIPPGPLRRVIEAAVQILPSGQALRVNQGIVPSAFEFAASCLLYVLIAVLGAAAFQSKDIN